MTNKKGHKYCPCNKQNSKQPAKKHENRKQNETGPRTEYNIYNNKNGCIETQRLKLNQALKGSKTRGEIKA